MKSANGDCLTFVVLIYLKRCVMFCLCVMYTCLCLCFSRPNGFCVRYSNVRHSSECFSVPLDELVSDECSRQYLLNLCVRNKNVDTYNQAARL